MVVRFIFLMLLSLISHAETVTFLTQAPVASANDNAARFLAKVVEEKTGHTIVVKNVSDTSGVIALRESVRGRNQVLFASSTMSPLLNDAELRPLVKSLTPVASTFLAGYSVFVPSGSQITDTKSLSEASKSKPLICAASGTFIAPVAASISKKFSARIELVYYRDRGQMAIDLMNGLVDCQIGGTSVGSIAAAASGGKIRSVYDFPDSDEEFRWGAIFFTPGVDRATAPNLATAITEAVSSKEFGDLLIKHNLKRSAIPASSLHQVIESEAAQYK